MVEVFMFTDNSTPLPFSFFLFFPVCLVLLFGCFFFFHRKEFHAIVRQPKITNKCTQSSHKTNTPPTSLLYHTHITSTPQIRNTHTIPATKPHPHHIYTTNATYIATIPHPSKTHLTLYHTHTTTIPHPYHIPTAPIPHPHHTYTTATIPTHPHCNYTTSTSHPH